MDLYTNVHVHVCVHCTSGLQAERSHVPQILYNATNYCDSSV